MISININDANSLVHFLSLFVQYNLAIRLKIHNDLKTLISVLHRCRNNVVDHSASSHSRVRRRSEGPRFDANEGLDSCRRGLTRPLVPPPPPRGTPLPAPRPPLSGARFAPFLSFVALRARRPEIIKITELPRPGTFIPRTYCPTIIPAFA